MTVHTRTAEERLADRIRASSQDLPAPDQSEAFGAAFDAFGDARVVLLGESTHGTSEFYTARAAITRRLIEHHGFKILAIEGDWPDAAELDRYVRGHGRWGERSAFVNFPRWMWRNREFAACLADCRRWNASRPAHERVAVRGLDVYSLAASVTAVLAYLERVDPAAAREAHRRYACLSPFLSRPQAYGARAQATGQTCEDEAVDQLIDLLERRLAYLRADGDDYFDAEQNARVVCAAEGYYRAMYRGAVESWNQRDAHMFDTLQRLLTRAGPDARAVVWAHNSHIGHAGATAMGEAGEFNLGQLCRRAFGGQAALIGFSTDRGKVMAADRWGGEARVQTLRPALPGSWEAILRAAGRTRSLLSWRRDDDLRAGVSMRRLERAVGVIYRPDSERESHYFDAHLSAQFDALVWFEETQALSPLPGRPPEGEPDTYPFGL